MMFLKHRYRLGMRPSARGKDSLSWSRFCRVPLGCRVPHPSTLEKITTRCGTETIAKLNEALLSKAGAAKVVRLDRSAGHHGVWRRMWRIRPIRGLLSARSRCSPCWVALITPRVGRGAHVRDRRRAAGRAPGPISAHLKLRNDGPKTRCGDHRELAGWSS